MTTVLIAAGVAIATASVGVFAGRKREETLDLFLSYRNRVGFPALAASLVATVSGAWILFSPAETATWAGMPGLVGYAVAQGLPIIVLVGFGPRLRRLLPAGYSLTSFVEHRFGRPLAVIVAVVSLFYMFVFLSAELTGIAQVYALRYNVSLIVPALVVAVLTLTYTALGGLRSSIVTDRVQFAAFLPLLILLLVVVGRTAGDGVIGSIAALSERAPELTGWNNPGGWQFAAVLIVGVTASNLLDQSFWQRVYAARNDRAVRSGFAIGGTITIAVIFLAGLFGFLAVERGVVDEGNASVALFALLQTLPEWILGTGIVLASLLVMSSVDSTVNGMVSAVWPFMQRRGTLGTARRITVGLAAAAVVVASFGFSVLYLFLLADLVCSAVVFPLIYGMFNERIETRGAVTAMVLGLVGGSVFFPTPAMESWSGLPANMFVAFGVALLLSAGITIGSARLGKRRRGSGAQP